MRARAWCSACDSGRSVSPNASTFSPSPACRRLAVLASGLQAGRAHVVLPEVREPARPRHRRVDAARLDAISQKPRDGEPLHRKDLVVEHERGVRRDIPVAALAVRELGLHGDDDAVAFADLAHTFFEAADHAVDPRGVLVGHAVGARVPELLAVWESADAVDDHQVAGLRPRACSLFREHVAKTRRGRDGSTDSRPWRGCRRRREIGVRRPDGNQRELVHCDPEVADDLPDGARHPRVGVLDVGLLLGIGAKVEELHRRDRPARPARPARRSAASSRPI